MKREAWDHPKFKLLARDLRLPMFAVRGLMESIWLVTGINFPQGGIRWSAEELAIAIDYPDDAEAMLEALVKRKLLEPIDGGWFVHDWHEHADDAVHMKLARQGWRFDNGAMPELRRLSKEQRERAMAKYQATETPEPAKEDVRTDPEPVRTTRKTVRTELHKSALPEPEPEPENISTSNREVSPSTREAAPADLAPQGSEQAARIPGKTEVAAFFRANASDGDAAKRFWNHYEAVGWKAGGAPIENWRGLATNWIDRDKQERTRGQPAGGKPASSRRPTTLERVTGGRIVPT